MYSIYLNTIKHRKEAERQQRKQQREALKRTKKGTASDNQDIQRHLSPPPIRGILKRTVTPFPISGLVPPPPCYSDPPALTKKISSGTAETEMLSDTESMEDTDFDWDAYLVGGEDDSFSYSVDEDDGEDAMLGKEDSLPSSNHKVVVDCRIPICTPQKSQCSFSSCSSDSSSSSDDEDDSLSVPYQAFESPDKERRMVQVLPGLKLPIKGTQNNIRALKDHSSLNTSHCTCCEQVLYCISEVTHVLCSDCQVVSPVFSSDRHRPSVGVGWNEEEFSTQLDLLWQNRNQNSNSSLPMPPLI